MNKLKECRFCKENEDIKIIKSGTCWVECGGCKCRGPMELFEEDAIKSWNDGINLKEKKNKND